MTYLESIRANDTADFCIRIIEQSLGGNSGSRPTGQAASRLAGFRFDPGRKENEHG